MNIIAKIQYEIYFKIAVYGILFISLFYSTYKFLFSWWEREDFSYCYLILPLALYLIWDKKERLKNEISKISWFGIVPITFGIVLFWLGELAGEYYSLYIASWLILIGLCWIHLGWEKFKIIWFPITFLLAMFPPPNAINFPLTLKFKILSSKIGVALIQAYGLSAYREGNVIDLGFTQLQVVDACSGLRFLYPLIIMAILLAYFYKDSFWKKVILVVSAIPITIITNSVRIAMTGILYKHFGADAAEGFFHGFSGWFIFMFALAILLLEMWVMNGFRGIFGTKLDADKHRNAQKNDNNLATDAHRRTSHSEVKAQSSKLEDKYNSGIEELGKLGLEKLKDKNENNLREEKKIEKVNFGDQQFENRNPQPANPWLKSLFDPPQFIVAVLLLGATLVLSQGVEFREKIPMSRSFNDFPLQVGDWIGKREVMELKFIEELDLSEYIIVDYRNIEGKLVNFYTAYYESQRKGESIHSPETCMPGGGWELRKAGLTNVKLNPSEMTVNRAFIVQGANKQLTYFWFPLRDRIANSLWEVKLYNFWDALTRQRTDGSLVRLVTPIYKGENVSDADKRLVDFTKEIVPVLKEYLPK